MTTKEKIEVMQAFEDGKTIECRCIRANSSWKVMCEPQWNWAECEYRVKPEASYRPYRNGTEFVLHWNRMTTPGETYQDVQHPFGGVWLRRHDAVRKVIGYNDDGIVLGGPDSWMPYGTAAASGFKYMDGTPFGIKDE